MTNTIERTTEAPPLNDEQRKVADELRDEFCYYSAQRILRYPFKNA